MSSNNDYNTVHKESILVFKRSVSCASMHVKKIKCLKTSVKSIQKKTNYTKKYSTKRILARLGRDSHAWATLVY